MRPDVRAPWLRKTLLALAVLVGLAFGLGLLLAARQETRAHAAWARVGSPPDAFAAAHPPAPDNPAVRRLQELARPLGIEMRGNRPLRVPRTDRGPDAASALRRAHVAEFVDQIARRPDDAPLAVPTEVASFLAENGAAIEALLLHVGGAGPLVWASDLREDVEAPLPPVAGIRQLNALLVAHGLAASSPVAARAGLDASAQLVRSVSVRPELVSQLLAAALDRVRLGAHRHLRLPVATAGWPEGDPRPQLRRSLQGDAWAVEHFVARTGGAGLPGQSIGGGPVARYLVVPLARPYLRLSAADYSSRMAAIVGRLGAEADPCRPGLDQELEEAASSGGRWNILAADAFPSVVRAWRAANEAALEQELTALALEATEAAAPASSPSRACPGRSWLREPRADGGVTLRLDPSTGATDPARPPVTFTIQKPPPTPPS